MFRVSLNLNMPIISAFGLFCCDTFEETPNKKVSNRFNALLIFYNTRGSLASLGLLDIHTSLPPRPGSISRRQSVFRHVLGQFSVGRVCSTTSQVIFGRQSVFRQFPGRFLVGRVCSATSWVDFRSAECVLPLPGAPEVLNGHKMHIFCTFSAHQSH